MHMAIGPIGSRYNMDQFILYFCKGMEILLPLIGCLGMIEVIRYYKGE